MESYIIKTYQDGSQVTVRDVQKVILEIAKVVDQICEKHHIPYIVNGGTALGVIRHQGFIPWDDDFDIMMPREDYEKFIDVAVKELPHNLILQCSKTLPTYWTGSAKVRTTEKSDFRQEKYKHLTENIGPYIDIFPLDYVPKEYSLSQKIQNKKVRILKLMLWYKSKLSNPKIFKKKLLKIYSSFFSVKQLQKKLRKEMSKFNNKKKNYYVNFGSVYGAKKQTIAVEKYGKPIMVPFENELFPIPQDYDFILKKIYKNYMKLPPLNKRKPKHEFDEHVSK